VAENGCAAYGACAANSQIEKLERCQNEAARIITGATRNTRIDSLLVEANLSPLKIRIEQLMANAYEKSTRLLPSNPRRDIVKDGEPIRLKRAQWREMAKSLAESTGLRSYRRESFEAFQFAPWDTGWCVLFNDRLLTHVIKAEDPEVCKKAAVETLSRLPDADVQFWTDGSAIGGVSHGGAGILEMDVTESKMTKKPAGRLSSSYRAEMVAILEAMTSLEERSRGWNDGDEKICLICTDSKSAVQKLSNGPWKQLESTPNEVWKKIIAVTRRRRCKIIMQWVPGHCDLVFNEVADTLAKEASKLPQEDQPIDFSAAKMCIRHAFKQKWENIQQPTYSMAKYVPSLKERGLTRREKVILSQLRTGGKSYLLNSYRYFISRDEESPHTPTCRYCQSADETVEHIFNECSNLNAARSELLMNLNGTCAMEKLYSEPKKALACLWKIGLMDDQL
jgi:ribonuclease HI